MQWSKVSPDGPWTDAFKFDMPYRQDIPFKLHHDYNEIVTKFRALCVDVTGESIEEAWASLLDMNGDGVLSYLEFTTACGRMRKLPGSRGRDQCLEDMQRLFQALDTDGHGTVELSDLQRNTTISPVAPWWRLTIFSTWASNASHSIALHGPLKLFATGREKEARVRLKNASRARNFGIAVPDYSKAFTIETLDLSTETLERREIARRCSVSFTIADDVHKKFLSIDVDGSGFIDKQEFSRLVLSLHGAVAGDLPQNRLDLFWRQADLDESGTIGFEEFLRWLTSIFPTGLGTKSLSKTFYASLASNVRRPRAELDTDKDYVELEL
jgi:Ca2+-binding EF-hand superfamily protein